MFIVVGNGLWALIFSPVRAKTSLGSLFLFYPPAGILESRHHASLPGGRSSMSKPRYAVRYARWSRGEQGRGETLHRQDREFKEFLRKHKLEPLPGYELPADDGVSGYNGDNIKRGSLADFLTLARSGQVPRGTVLVVENQDRLSRERTSVVLKLFQQLIESGVYIGDCFTDRIIDEKGLDDPMVLMMIVMGAARSNEYARTLGKRSHDNWEAKRRRAVEKKEPMTKMCPWWLRLREDRSGYDVIEEKASIMRRIFELAALGKGCHAIVDMLEREGFSSPTGKGRFHQNVVIRWLKDKAVLGHGQPCVRESKHKSKAVGEAVEGYYPAIVGRETWDRVQAFVGSRNLRKGRPPKPTRVNVFQGLLFDPDYKGAPYHIDLKDGSDYRLLKSKYGRGGSVISYEKLIEAFLLYVKEIDPAVFDAKEDDGVEAQRDRVDKLRRKVAATNARYASEEEADYLLPVMRDLDTKLKAAVKTLDELEAMSRNPIRKAVQALKEGDIRDPASYQARLRLAVSRITLRVRELPFMGRKWKVADVATYFRGGYIRLFTFIYRNSRGYLASPLKLHQGFKVSGQKLGPWQETLDGLHRQIFFSEQLRQEIEAAGDSYPPDIDVDLERWLEWARDNPEEAAELQAESDEETASGWRER
jgi:DNA invertase Pin-like site-specific DNA recombinase